MNNGSKNFERMPRRMDLISFEIFFRNLRFPTGLNCCLREH